MDEQNKPIEQGQSVAEEATPEETGSRGGNKYLLPAAIVLAALLVGGAIFYSSRAKAPTTTGDTVGQAKDNTADIIKLTPRDVILGNKNAPVTLIEYGDYQCPFCERFFSDTQAGLNKDYIPQGKVKMVFRNFAFLGPESVASAAAAECANDQGKYWDYHDALYVAEGKDNKENNGNLNRTLFMKIASNLKLNTDDFGKCIDSQKYTNLIQTDTEQAQAFGINGTPYFYVNSQKFAGLTPYTQVKAVIDSLLAGK